MDSKYYADVFYLESINQLKIVQQDRDKTPESIMHDVPDEINLAVRIVKNENETVLRIFQRYGQTMRHNGHEFVLLRELSDEQFGKLIRRLLGANV